MNNQMNFNQIGAKIRFLRKQRGLTLKTLSDKLGYMTHGYLSEIETGKKMPSMDFILGFCDLLEISIDQLLKGESLSTPCQVKKLTANVVEKIRLILSTYQDGTGMLIDKEGLTLPGWRDFERAVALALGGEAQESKYIFDVLLPVPGPDHNIKYGISCKMRRELDRLNRDGRVTIEISNSAGKFWDNLNLQGITQSNYKECPAKVGKALINLIEQWHQSVSLDQGGSVNLPLSYYLVLSWNKKGRYQLHQFDLKMPDPEKIKWYFPTVGNQSEILARRLTGNDETGALFEWYGESGGQLKYYPLAKDALWTSEQFQLEPLKKDTEYGILEKVAMYFPELWAKVCRE